MIITATVPTAIIGLLFNDFFSDLYNSMAAVGFCLLITGVLLWIVERMRQTGKNIREMKFGDALLVGLFQSIAIAPGISRSGATISGSLFSGLNRALAIKFAFLISVPSILGAIILEAPAAFEEGMDTSLLLPIISGVVVAAVSGFIAIKTMIRVVSDKKLYIFSIYTWIVGALVLIYSFIS